MRNTEPAPVAKKSPSTPMVKSGTSIAALAAVTSAMTAVAQQDTPQPGPDPRIVLIRKLSSTNDVDRLEGLQTAQDFSLRVMLPLATTMDSKDMETGRRAKHALQRLLRVAAQPGSTERRVEAEARLIGIVQKKYLSPQTRGDLIWMLSEIATARSVQPIAELLTDKDLGESARCALTRMPYPEAVAALKKAFEQTDEDFKYPLADSLRARGEKVEGFESKKLKPTAQTTVKAPEPKK